MSDAGIEPETSAVTFLIQALSHAQKAKMNVKPHEKFDMEAHKQKLVKRVENIREAHEKEYMFTRTLSGRPLHLQAYQASRGSSEVRRELGYSCLLCRDG